MKKLLYTFMFSFSLVIMATLNGFPQDGSLDLTFGIEGKVTTAITGYIDYGKSLAIQQDGKILVAGGYSVFALARYQSDGALDNTFAGDGTTITNFAPANFSGASSLAIQDDGKIVVAGHRDRGTGYDFAVVRYLSNGGLDLSFGDDGKVITSFGDGNNSINAVAVQADGKIVVAGSSHQVAGDNHFAMARYNINGSLDQTFSSDGKLITTFSSNYDVATAIAIQRDGKIVVAGYSFNGTNEDFALARYNTDGKLDNTFSADGKLTTAIGTGSDVAASLAIQSDDKIVVAGSSETNLNYDMAIVRYNSDGRVDSTFDQDGKVTTDFDSLDQYANAVVIQDDGKIVIAGDSDNGFNNDFVLVRYTREGSLDGSFGFDGEIITDFEKGDDSGLSMAIQPDGYIVVAGTATINNANEFALARYVDGTVSSAQIGSGNSHYSISPNPFTNELWIRGTKENEYIILYDLVGIAHIRQIAADTATKINTEGLLPGCYFLQLTNGPDTVITKLIKL